MRELTVHGEHTATQEQRAELRAWLNSHGLDMTDVMHLEEHELEDGGHWVVADVLLRKDGKRYIVDGQAAKTRQPIQDALPWSDEDTPFGRLMAEHS